MAQKAITIYTPEGTEPHIAADDDASIYYNMLNNTSGVVDGLDKKQESNNKLRLLNGLYCIQGHYIRVLDYEDLTIQTGTSGQNRNDLVVCEFVRGGSNVADTLQFKIITGTSTTGTAIDPKLIQEDLPSGGVTRQEALYRIRMQGFNIAGIDDLRTYAHTYRSNRNILLDSHFQLWEEGTEFKPIKDGGQYTAELWFCDHSISGLLYVSMANDLGGLKMEWKKAGTAILRQYIETGDANYFHGKTVTLSSCVNNVTEYKTYVFDKSKPYVEFLYSNQSSGTTKNIDWVKLEEGAVATPCIRERRSELVQLTRRYFQKISISTRARTCTSGSVETAYYTINFPKMRVTPTIKGTFKTMWSNNSTTIYDNLDPMKNLGGISDNQVTFSCEYTASVLDTTLESKGDLILDSRIYP